jgi:hypothetical protein
MPSAFGVSMPIVPSLQKTKQWKKQVVRGCRVRPGLVQKPAAAVVAGKRPSESN